MGSGEGGCRGCGGSERYCLVVIGALGFPCSGQARSGEFLWFCCEKVVRRGKLMGLFVLFIFFRVRTPPFIPSANR